MIRTLALFWNVKNNFFLSENAFLATGAVNRFFNEFPYAFYSMIYLFRFNPTFILDPAWILAK